MSYSRDEFALDLESILATSDQLDCGGIAEWAYDTRLRHLGAIDPKVGEWLLQLGAMDMGAEFELTKEELQQLVAAAREP